MIGNTIEDLERIGEKIEEAREFISNVRFPQKRSRTSSKPFQFVDRGTFDDVKPTVECIGRLSDVHANLNILYFKYGTAKNLLDNYDPTGAEMKLLETLRDEYHELERLYHQKAGMFGRAA